MIIGTYIEPALNVTGNALNGATAVVFYTEREAVAWCLAMSEIISFTDLTVSGCTIMYNTETGNKRWWYNGVEYTG